MLIVYFFKHERKGFQNEIVIIIKKDEPVIFQHFNSFLERGENSGKACYI